MAHFAMSLNEASLLPVAGATSCAFACVGAGFDDVGAWILGPAIPSRESKGDEWRHSVVCALVHTGQVSVQQR